ncbi:MAG: VWA domain-containing protein [Proteobacteria bacterium]|nr:VWA domain-containing protein [Pseudomonadota bacterium]NDD04101.1 VWA domain-containing protein [Pseudomonadota bacterium]
MSAHFFYPKLLWALIPIALLAVFFIFRPRKEKEPLLSKMPGPWEQLKSAIRRTRWAFRVLFLLQLLALGLLVVVIARPTRTKTLVKKSTEGVDIVLVLDVSESMDAEDLSPSRILAAKQVIRQFISQRPNDRIGLVTFGGESIMMSPLTRDFEFLLGRVEEVRLRELKQGTAIGLGITNGIARLRKSQSKNKVLILLTDGDSNVGSINPVTASKLAAQEGIRIYPIGIGQQDRVVVPIYAVDGNGKRLHVVAQVPSYLNPKLLKEIADNTGGKSYMARDTGMLSRILQEIDKLEKTKIKVHALSETEELFFYPAALATLLFAICYVLLETRFQRKLRKIKRPGDAIIFYDHLSPIKS